MSKAFPRAIAVNAGGNPVVYGIRLSLKGAIYRSLECCNGIAAAQQLNVDSARHAELSFFGKTILKVR